MKVKSTEIRCLFFYLELKPSIFFLILEYNHFILRAVVFRNEENYIYHNFIFEDQNSDVRLVQILIGFVSL